MKVIIYVFRMESEEFELVDCVRLVDGRAVPEPELANLFEPVIIEPGTFREIRPEEGETYLRNLPTQYAHRTFIEAHLDGEPGESVREAGRSVTLADRVHSGR
ncbi:MAG: hypothetical protein ACLP0J_28390 [Solirubrobacteraceae bacterium]